ncbi:hypothetical protein T265_10010 [Opisthorchis viverrini]|nr:hypothetical protein T265_10010 [Opisthorchis viverrini]KER21732.1 hypothetical protein T265_10010 [Opisthorchis viverrini]
MDYMKNTTSYRPLTSSSEVPDLSSLTEDVAIADITKAGPDIFAKQITLIELSLFKAIKREEFSSLKWNGKEKHIYAPNIVASTRWFNQINFWVQKEILKYSCVSKRTELLAFFIKMAKKLVDYNNLYSAMSIVSALQVECIYRLRHTWDGLPNKDRAAYRRLEELFSQNDNCRRQREHMNSISLPGIPYLGLYLSDLTYTNVAHPRVGGKPTAIWTSKINTIIDIIAYFQQSEYPFNVDGTINAYLCAQRYIEELQKFLEEDNYRTSLRLEPQPEPVIHTCSVYVPTVEDGRTMTGFLKCPSETTPTRGVRPSEMIPRGHQNQTLRSSKSASVNSSFESDMIPVAQTLWTDCKRANKSVTALASPTPPAPFDTSAANLCTPIVRTKKKSVVLDTNNSVLTMPKPSKVLFSDDGPPQKLHALQHNTLLQGDLKDNLTTNFPLSTDIDAESPTRSHHRPTHYHQPETPSTENLTKSPEHLPPIPPRPPHQSCDSIHHHRHKARTQRPSLSSSFTVDAPDESVPCPERLPNALDEVRLERSTDVLDLKCRKISESVLSSLTQSSTSQSPPISSTPTKRVSSVPVLLSDSLDATAAAVCAATVCATDLGRLELGSEPNPVPSLPSCTTTQADVSVDESVPQQSSCTLKIPSVSTPAVQLGSEQRKVSSSHKAFFPPSIGLSQFDVQIVYQGVVQRRTLVRARTAAFSGLAALLSPKLRKGPANVYGSNSSLSTVSAVVGGGVKSSSSLMHARPAGFSSWHRLWATLVVVGSGSSAFMIYFQPKCKNAMLRNEFRAHQCQVQSLINFRGLHPLSSSQHMLSDDSTNATSHVPEYTDEVEDGDASELLQDEGDTPAVTTSEPELAKSPVRRTNRGHSVPTAMSTGLFNCWAQIELGHHRDGTVDVNSFLLSDPNRHKVYRFRPVLARDSLPAFTRSTGPFDWLRRSGFHSPKVMPRASQPSVVMDTSRSRPSPFGFSSLGRPRGASVPTALTSSLVSPTSSRSATLKHIRTTKEDPGLPGSSTSNPVVDEWIRALHTALNSVEQFHRHRFIAYHAQRYCEEDS